MRRRRSQQPIITVYSRHPWFFSNGFSNWSYETYQTSEVEQVQKVPPCFLETFYQVLHCSQLNTCLSGNKWEIMTSLV
ncbi:hypothetical protein E2C01_054474 [Portunus trituberculatus]|uniref:Uncharacterized protein n=1 Tax=Portunus trituberculatus TaxID=210409 RepID=A0A5B7GJN1_PORTR|nr:hypothetical protein [Portunus trituberculatus]